MTTILQDLINKIRVAERWIGNLICLVLLMMLYVRPERKGEFSLRLHVCKEITPYFFTAGHRNYPKDSTACLKTMERQPNSLLDKFTDGEHLVHLKDGLFNGIWHDY